MQEEWKVHYYNLLIMGIRKIAATYSGRDRLCEKCPFRYTSDCVRFNQICNESFIRGFIKGVKYQKSKKSC